jgi:hypothetical protein
MESSTPDMFAHDHDIRSGCACAPGVSCPATDTDSDCFLFVLSQLCCLLSNCEQYSHTSTFFGFKSWTRSMIAACSCAVASATSAVEFRAFAADERSRLGANT